MISALFGQTNYVAAKKMLDATVLRHEAIASNLADFETPNYRRLEVPPALQIQRPQALAGGSVPQIENLKPRIGPGRGGQHARWQRRATGDRTCPPATKFPGACPRQDWLTGGRPSLSEHGHTH